MTLCKKRHQYTYYIVQQCLIRMIVIIVLLFLTIVAQASKSYHCPCGGLPSKVNNTVNVHDVKICVVSSYDSTIRFELYDRDELENFVFYKVGDGHSLQSCSVIIHLNNTSAAPSSRSLCPGLCRPYPDVVVFEQLLIDQSNMLDKNTAVTCSLTIDMLRKLQNREVKKNKANKHGHVMQYLREIAVRRLMECYERNELLNGLTLGTKEGSTTARILTRERVTRRRVKAVVMWMGTADGLALISAQATVLNHLRDQRDDPENVVIGWAATDEVHPCIDETTKCLSGNKQFDGLLPPSAVNYMPVGWRCAQRRPLRSLAHVLTLFAPSFVILLDDDTYLNYKLLMKRHESYLMRDMRLQPLYLGEFMGREGDRGHLSTKGIFAGGSGYVIGHNLLLRLQQRAVTHFGFEGKGYSPKEVAKHLNSEDWVRSAEHRTKLSVLKEGMESVVSHACNWFETTGGVTRKINGASENNITRCILSTDPVPVTRVHSNDNQVSQGSTSQRMVVPIAVRLVDFCTNLMANEHTCQHSDHSLGRCLIYGAEAIPVGVVCHSTAPLHSIPADMRVGMCFMTPSCNVSEQVTCHRYRASAEWDPVSEVLLPERNSKKDGYYRHHSSVFDGNTTEMFG